MQASIQWRAPEGTLGELTAASLARAHGARDSVAALERTVERMPPAVSLSRALAGPCVSLIAEVKRRSPSKGDIAPALDAAAQAIAYELAGAAAVSVLTEPDRFGGSLTDLADVGAAVSVPVVRKDFVVDRVQLLEARVAGAAAALLIVRALRPELLRSLIADGAAIGLDLLVEVRARADLDCALACGASIIGVNNRNLETLMIDPAVAEALVPLVPASCVAVAESGITGVADVQRYARAGADAVLVGSILSAAQDVVSSARALAAVVRVPRG